MDEVFNHSSINCLLNKGEDLIVFIPNLTEVLKKKRH